MGEVIAFPARRPTGREGFIRQGEAAAHLAVSRSTVVRWQKELGLPVHRLGKCCLYLPSELDAWVRGRGGLPDLQA